MDRKEFLSLIGISAGGLVLASCMGACNGQFVTPAPTPLTIDFTLNLTDPANAPLKNKGGVLYNQGVIVAQTLTGIFIAVASSCTHQGQTVQFQSSNNGFVCYAHGSTFSTTGAVTNGPASYPLQQMKTTLTGNMLRVQS